MADIILFWINAILTGIGLHTVGGLTYRAIMRLHTRWTAWTHAGDIQAAENRERIE